MFTATSGLWNSSPVVGKHYRVARQFVHKPQSISYRLVVDIHAKTQTLGSYAIRWVGQVRTGFRAFSLVAVVVDGRESRGTWDGVNRLGTVHSGLVTYLFQ
jgi:hypothetical protein